MDLIARIPAFYSFGLVTLLWVWALPSRFAWLGLPLALGVIAAIGQVNETKIALLSLPLTFFDVRTAAADPATLINALGLRVAVFRFSVAALILAALAFAVSRSAWVRSRRAARSTLAAPRTPIGQAVLVRGGSLLVIVATGAGYLMQYGRYTQARLASNAALSESLWLPETQVQLSQQLGVIEYLVYTMSVGSLEVGASGGARGPSDAEVRVAITPLLSAHARSPGEAPNVVLFHAESVFDPNSAFRLERRVESILWSPRPETKAIGPLRVNAIGGGSWITEFEVITGVDSRLFGYHGFYTHYYIAPRVRRSFIHHLADRGYATAVYYPADRTFYNAGVAFAHYGFSTFVDATDLELPADWTHLVDREIVEAVIRSGAFERPGPFIYFLSTSENHGPHPCHNFSDPSQFLTTFAGDIDFELNCQLNEYLKRAASTAAGVELVLGQLKQIEEQSGRPFVLLVYGDHQPWSFTEGVFSVAGGVATDPTTASFSGVRSEAGANETVFHVMSSVEGLIVADLPARVSATLLPTLVSGYTARSWDDLYLPINLMAAMECGADLLSSSCQGRDGMRSALMNAILDEP